MSASALRSSLLLRKLVNTSITIRLVATADSRVRKSLRLGRISQKKQAILQAPFALKYCELIRTRGCPVLPPASRHRPLISSGNYAQMLKKLSDGT